MSYGFSFIRETSTTTRPRNASMSSFWALSARGSVLRTRVRLVDGRWKNDVVACIRGRGTVVLFIGHDDNERERAGDIPSPSSSCCCCSCCRCCCCASLSSSNTGASPSGGGEVGEVFVTDGSLNPSSLTSLGVYLHCFVLVETALKRGSNPACVAAAEDDDDGGATIVTALFAMSFGQNNLERIKACTGLSSTFACL